MVKLPEVCVSSGRATLVTRIRRVRSVRRRRSSRRSRRYRPARSISSTSRPSSRDRSIATPPATPRSVHWIVLLRPARTSCRRSRPAQREGRRVSDATRCRLCRRFTCRAIVGSCAGNGGADEITFSGSRCPDGDDHVGPRSWCEVSQVACDDCADGALALRWSRRQQLRRPMAASRARAPATDDSGPWLATVTTNDQSDSVAASARTGEGDVEAGRLTPRCHARADDEQALLDAVHRDGAAREKRVRRPGAVVRRQVVRRIDVEEADFAQYAAATSLASSTRRPLR